MLLVGHRADKVQGISGFAFVQAVHSGDDLLVVSSWRGEKDMRAYVDSELAQEMLKRLSSLFAAGPTVKNFAIALAVESAEGFFTRDEGEEG